MFLRTIQNELDPESQPVFLSHIQSTCQISLKYVHDSLSSVGSQTQMIPWGTSWSLFMLHFTPHVLWGHVTLKLLWNVTAKKHDWLFSQWQIHSERLSWHYSQDIFFLSLLLWMCFAGHFYHIHQDPDAAAVQTESRSGEVYWLQIQVLAFTPKHNYQENMFDLESHFQSTISQ